MSSMKQYARHLGTEHHEHYLSKQDSLDIIPKLADIWDEPFADASEIPTYLVSKKHFLQMVVMNFFLGIPNIG